MDEPTDSSDDSESNIDDELIDQLEERRRKRREEGNRPGATPRRKIDPDGGSGGAGRRGTRISSASSDGRAASSGAFGLYGLRTGESVFIRVNASEPGGYSVFIEQNKKLLPGYLPTQARLKTGERLLSPRLYASTRTEDCL